MRIICSCSAIITYVILTVHANFVFKDESTIGSTLLTFNFTATSCARNVTIQNQLVNFRRKFQKLTHLSFHELHQVDEQGFQRTKTKFCNKRCDLVADMSDKIRLITQFCIKDDERQQRSVEINSLLLIRTYLYFACEMSESQFTQIYEHKAYKCIRRHQQDLNSCAISSYTSYFWESSPTQPPSVIDLVHGAVC